MEDDLIIDNLIVEFATKSGYFPAVRGVSLNVRKGKTLVVLGESGSGKSVLLRSILRITPPKAKVSGAVNFHGRNLLGISEKEMQEVRGNRIALIFQDALSALDPLFRVGDQIRENIVAHRKESKSAITAAIIELFHQVGIPSPEERIKAFPHEMSGGMRQRAVIAMALACNPDILLADEPTTALDVTIQAQILKLFRTIQSELGMSIIMVTHDMTVAAEMADDIAIMYAGKIVEYGSAEHVINNPAHPYTQGLINATISKGHTGRLFAIPGQPPLISAMPPGCAFALRCSQASSSCTVATPDLEMQEDGKQVACYAVRDHHVLT